MKQSLQLRLGQQLTMTPQLQQAIRLLQLSTLELQQEIQEAIETNPMLEMQAEEGERETDRRELESVAEPSENAETAETEARESEEIPEDLPVDAAWDDIYEPTVGGAASRSDEHGREFEQGDEEESLIDHLRWQMRLSHFSERDEMLAEAIIDAIDEDGYLACSLEDLRGGLDSAEEVELDELEAVLMAIQNFDPPGVGARNLQECMLLQIKQLPTDTPWLKEARHLVAEHLVLLAGHDYAQLMRRLRLPEEDLQQIILLIQSLNPRPGGQVSGVRTEYIIPDLIVHKAKNTWKVELNTDAIPRLRINSVYANMVKRANDSSDNTYMKNQLQEARWFLKSLQSRNETLLKVGKCIVERQRGFFEYGEEAMKALVLHDVAEVVNMHESTISRVTNKKYMHTPRGIFELKYFFSSHVSTVDGGECSSTAIRALIKKLVSAEDARRPLSDSKLADVLTAQGINVARRTIAKYREALCIPPSNERKRLS
ncbi:MAG: RNA polymerase factor sigma-54 [Gammaproteobacteria bacterium RBG_16_57_12]|nr:MAG: RNA polymerase factor sigma-54 [Gammaproteobacteria bacterium RBG_16_57_12]